MRRALFTGAGMGRGAVVGFALANVLILARSYRNELLGEGLPLGQLLVLLEPNIRAPAEARNE